MSSFFFGGNLDANCKDLAHLCDVLERGGIDGGAGQVVEGERLVHVLDVHQHLEDPDVVLQPDPLRRLPTLALLALPVAVAAVAVGLLPAVFLSVAILAVPVLAVSVLARYLNEYISSNHCPLPFGFYFGAF